MAKVLIVPRWYPYEKNPSHGVFVKEFAKATALYNNVTVLFGELTEDSSPKWPYEVRDQFEDGIHTVRFVYKRQPLKLHRIINLLGFGHLFYKLIREGSKPDIVHFHVYLGSLSVFVLAKLFRIPIVATEHWSAFITDILTPAERFLARFILNRVSIILPVSDYLKRHIKPYAPKTRFEVVPNIVDVKIFRVSRVTLKKKNETKQMLMVGRLDPGKGVSYLLEALNVLKEIRTDFFLNIIGDGTERKLLEKNVQAMNLTNFVHFHGIVQKGEVAEEMSTCDFFVLPTLFETFSCVIIEAMACGKPVVTTHVGALREIVTDQSGILVEAGNAESLKDGIDFMLDNYASYSPIDISNDVRGRFSLEVVGQKLNQVYKEMLLNTAANGTTCRSGELR